MLLTLAFHASWPPKRNRPGPSQRSSLIELTRFTTPALFAVAAMSLLLVFIGIHNAWDTVVYLTVDRMK